MSSDAELQALYGDYYSTGFFFLHVEYVMLLIEFTLFWRYFSAQNNDRGGGYFSTKKKMNLCLYCPGVIFCLKPEWIWYTQKLGFDLSLFKLTLLVYSGKHTTNYLIILSKSNCYICKLINWCTSFELCWSDKVANTCKTILLLCRRIKSKSFRVLMNLTEKLILFLFFNHSM